MNKPEKYALSTWQYNVARVLECLRQVVKERDGHIVCYQKMYEWQKDKTYLIRDRNASDEPVLVRQINTLSFLLDRYCYHIKFQGIPFLETFYGKEEVIVYGQNEDDGTTTFETKSIYLEPFPNIEKWGLFEAYEVGVSDDTFKRTAERVYEKLIKLDCTKQVKSKPILPVFHSLQYQTLP